MNLKKNVLRSLMFSFVVFLLLLGCTTKHCSPDIVNVNVINENGEELNNCIFSATLDGKQISDLNYYFEDFSNYSYPQEYAVYDSETQKLSGNVITVKSAYTLYSLRFSDILDEMETITRDNMEDLHSRIKITVACPGYESLVFTPILKEFGHVAADISVQLKKK